MPGGPEGAWEALRPMLQAAAARAEDGTPVWHGWDAAVQVTM